MKFVELPGIDGETKTINPDRIIELWRETTPVNGWEERSPFTLIYFGYWSYTEIDMPVKEVKAICEAAAKS